MGDNNGESTQEKVNVTQISFGTRDMIIYVLYFNYYNRMERDKETA